MGKLERTLGSGAVRHRERWDPSGLLAVDRSIIDAYESGLRVRVRRVYGDGEVFERTGTIGITTGWRPAFLLMHRATQNGSWDVIGPGDFVSAVRCGRTYRPGTVSVEESP
jgi:hypothetical protein